MIAWLIVKNIKDDEELDNICCSIEKDFNVDVELYEVYKEEN